jgi:YVTN family beta-propeller protein
VPAETLGTISVVDTSTKKIVNTIELPKGARPMGTLISRDGSRLFVVNGLSDDMTVVDTASAKALKTLPMGRVPHTVVVDD